MTKLDKGLLMMRSFRDKTKIIFKPHYNPNKNWVKEIDPRTMDSNIESFKVSEGDRRKVTFCKPFAVLSKTAYSSPVTLPLGLAYVASVLVKAGYNTNIIDATGDESPVKMRESEDKIYNLQGLSSEEIIERIDPKTFIFGVSLMFSTEWELHRTFIEKVKKKYPNIIIVAGGEHASSIPEYVLRDCPELDYIIRGEGEFSMLEFTHSIFNGNIPKTVPGVCFIDKDNKFVDNGYSKRIELIDTLPRPAWHLLNVENYFNDAFTSGLSKGRNMPILATRGCPFQCTFCSSPTMWTTRYVMREPKEIIDEMEWLIDKYQANDFEFFDLTAIIKKSWILDFCEELIKRKLKITWQLPSGTRSEALDHETLQAIYDSGCRFITYAPESGSEKSLALIKKRVVLSRLLKSIKAAVKIGHGTKLNFIIGFPHETHLDYIKTILFGAYVAARYGVSDINYAIFTAYPGSELFEELRKQKKLEMNRAYFEKLLVQFDVTITASYCENVSGTASFFYRLLGFSLSYIAIYVARPIRIFNLIKSLFKEKFLANNILEQRLYDIAVRNKMSKITKKS